jgi:ABC-type antimicrobial peptide transport system permease subunit
MRRVIYLTYLTVAGGVLGGMLGLVGFFILASIVHNLLVLTSTGWKIEVFLLPSVGYLSIAFPAICIVAGIVVSIRKGTMQKSERLKET